MRGSRRGQEFVVIALEKAMDTLLRVEGLVGLLQWAELHEAVDHAEKAARELKTALHRINSRLTVV